ncbi:hypothetical protein Syun_004264 [Stephania yunnanensis]|uniref:Protein kinase domain-containing protein n=1 Tax=Stephania yunnanensis TaxID=152371 RepID=A0AAP0L2Q3_9MAGN
MALHDSEGITAKDLTIACNGVVKRQNDWRRRGYIHYDIKPHNIFIFPTKYGKIDMKIVDFGEAKRVNSGKSSVKNFMGTTIYISPESLVQNEQKLSCDIWDLGCIVVEMVTRGNA